MRVPVLVGFLALVQPLSARAQRGGSVQASVDKALNRPEFQGVRAAVVDGVATLSGSVRLYENRLNAEVKVGQVGGVRLIADRIVVAGPAVSDRALQASVERRVHAKRIAVKVRDGVVVLDGQHVDRLAAQAAIHTAARTPGVRGVVDEIAVSERPDLGPMPYTISSVP